jgi:GDP-4-dehydro-6-deoxy-D-mannose reductase
MRLLVTGITGFVGSHMTEYALTRGAEVSGSMRWRSKTENIDHLRERITLVECDLRDLSSVRNLLEITEPTHVVHLAAQSFVAASWKAPAETLTTNIISQVNLFEAMRGLKIAPRFLAIGSSEEYGLVHPDELPIKETNPLRPLSPYAVSKVTQDMLGYQYFKSYGLPIIRTRAFNHEGPRRGDVFVTSNFARQITEIEAGLREPVIFVGDLKPKRDYSSGATGRCWSGGSRARCTISARASRGPSSTCSTSCSASPGSRASRSRSIRRGCDLPT